MPHAPTKKKDRKAAQRGPKARKKFTLMAAARKAKAWTKLDANPMYAKAVHMPWILIDEGSTESAEVFAALDSTLQQSVRAAGTYAATGLTTSGSSMPSSVRRADQAVTWAA